MDKISYNPSNTLESFITSLETGNIKLLKSVSKSDCHTHGYLSGLFDILKDKYDLQVNVPPTNFIGLNEMIAWANIVINELLKKNNQKEVYKILVGLALHRAKEDGLVVMEIGFSAFDITYFNNDIYELKDTFIQLCSENAPNVKVKPEIYFPREKDPELFYTLLKKNLSLDFFTGIDLCGDELFRSINEYRKHFLFAKEKGLKLKAHVGEIGKPDDPRKAVEILGLDAVQHGIQIANSPFEMEWFADKQIPLNICPISNVKLNYVSDLSQHPIKKLYDSGVLVTINTDNSLINGIGLSEEYLHLYSAGLFSANELDDIRIKALEISLKY